jgi:hypothetical protein
MLQSRWEVGWRGLPSRGRTLSFCLQWWVEKVMEGGGRKNREALDVFFLQLWDSG